MKIDENQVIEGEEVVSKKERIKRAIIRKKSDDESSSSSFFNKENITIGEFFVSDGFKHFLIFLLGIMVSFVGFYSFNNYLLIHERKANGELSFGISKVYDSVVYIRNYKNGKVVNGGSGFIYKKDNEKGYILTNYHIVKDAGSIEVVLTDDTVVSAEYLGGDDYLDVACISIDDKYVKQVATLGTSDYVSLGDTLFTVGAPGGFSYRGTVARGILAKTDRQVSVTNSDGNDYDIKLMQTDTLLKSGNSGGPLCNNKGVVVGINSSRFVKNEDLDIGYAVSIDDVKEHLKSFEKGKEVKKPTLGIKVFDVSNTKAISDYNLDGKIDSDLTSGVVVQSVNSNSVSSGKLKKGDVVVKFNKVTIEDVSDFRTELLKCNTGDKVTIVVNRDGKNKKIKIVLK